MQCIAVAVLKTIETSHAAAVIDFMICNIYAGCLACVLAEHAILAFIRIDDRAEHGKARE